MIYIYIYDPFSIQGGSQCTFWAPISSLGGSGVPHGEPFLRSASLFLRLGRTKGPFWGHRGAARAELEAPGHPRTPITQITQMTQTPKRCSRCSGSTVFNVRKGIKRAK